MMCLNFTMIIK